MEDKKDIEQEEAMKRDKALKKRKLAQMKKKLKKWQEAQNKMKRKHKNATLAWLILSTVYK